MMSINIFLLMGLYPISSLFIANQIFKKCTLKISIMIGIVNMLI